MIEQLTQDEVRRIMRGEHVPLRQSGQRMIPQELVIIMPLPPKETHPNARCHWARKAKATAKQRFDAGKAIREYLLHANYWPPEWKAATVQVTFYRARGRKADADNLLAWLKATFDALQDLRIVSNDSGLTHLPPIQRNGKAAGGRDEIKVLIQPTAEGGTC